MMNRNEPAGKAASLVLSRRFAAPRDRVFAAYTQPDQMKRWWGPQGFTIPESRADLRAGGIIEYSMRSSEGAVHWVRGVIDQIAPPSFFATACLVEDTNGRALFRVVTLVNFDEGGADSGGGTLLTLETIAAPIVEGIEAPTEGMRIGTTQHLDRLEAELARMPVSPRLSSGRTE